MKRTFFLLTAALLLLAALPSKAQNVEVTGDHVRLRYTPTTQTSSNIFRQVNSGTTLPYKGESDDGKWFRVEYDGTDLYIYKQFARLVSEDSATDTQPAEAVAGALPMKRVKVGKKVFHVADVEDVSAIYKPEVDKSRTFVVISKREFRLYVYEVQGADTALVAHFPVCYARYPEGKTRQGDMRTPDCNMRHPFRICEIKDASAWTHDFKDGRGPFRAYGKWFLRLDLKGSDNTPSVQSNRSIGIHGSSGNAESVPGRDSEGCIRLRDPDLVLLKENYVQVGTKVVILPYQSGKMPFEQACEERLGDYYMKAVPGNPLCRKYEVVE